MKSNCHTHTTHCDGKNTAEEMINSAIQKGLVSLGFSGHSPMDYPNDWEMNKESVPLYINEIHNLAEKYREQIDVICGIELDADYESVDIEDFDYSIGSVHQLKIDGEIYSMDYTADELQRCIDEKFGGDSTLMAKAYFDKLADFIINEEVDVVGHYDLITKFNEKVKTFNEDDVNYQKAAIDALKRIIDAKPGMIFEVNTGAMYRKGNKKPYPAEFILRRINELGGKVTITSDAHCTDALDFAFEEAKRFCQKCGFETVCLITKKGWTEYKL